MFWAPMSKWGAGAHVYMVEFNKTLKVVFHLCLGALIYSAWSFLLTRNKKTEKKKTLISALICINLFVPIREEIEEYVWEMFPWNDWNNIKNYGIMHKHYKGPTVNSRALKAEKVEHLKTLPSTMQLRKKLKLHRWLSIKMYVRLLYKPLFK